MPHWRMGILTDYFIATDDAAAAGALAQGPTSAFRTVEGNGLEPTVHLGTLEEILTGRSFEEILDEIDDAGPVAQEDDFSSFVQPISQSLLEALKAASRDDLLSAATAWSLTEELTGADPESLLAFLTDLVELARTAEATNCAVYCWVCL